MMTQCLVLAHQGLGYVAPNPLVGAVLVHNQRIIGAGYHMAYGEAHAEPNCIASVQEADKGLIEKSTLYVNLEPCNHHGKTPPCTQAIIAAGIKHVVIGLQDPFEHVNGNGIKTLQAAGINIEILDNAKQCMSINRRFLTWVEKKRPYIILKWSQTADGYIARNNKVQTAISSVEFNTRNHQWRAEEAAVLIGHNTAFVDNPNLTVRHVQGQQPVRLLWDPQLAIAQDANIFSEDATTFVFNNVKQEGNYLKAENIKEILQRCYEQNIQSIIVEGGAKLHQKFIDENLWDEARVASSSEQWGSGYAAAILKNQQHLYNEQLGKDTIAYYKNLGNKYL
ncbi:MAG: bifunctional diaminohydroxyphosphoribosylaminopyrimidine [Bacteroidota bacterium]|jgi:diaminohydroxyphosphoribosylaminopyrimidine deaminase/5-amino-6-(5-phosphoribosylamino)uracil reductase